VSYLGATGVYRDPGGQEFAALVTADFGSLVGLRVWTVNGDAFPITVQSAPRDPRSNAVWFPQPPEPGVAS
jgi:hypothetical protein